MLRLPPVPRTVSRPTPAETFPMKLLPALLFLFTATLPALRAEDLPRANAIEEDAVRALLGKKSIITGKVTDAFESPKGMTFLNLDGGKFTVVAWKESYDKFEGGSPAKLYKDKTVEVTGEVFEYRSKSAAKTDPGKLEIKLTSPDQIKILTPASDAKPEEPQADPKDKSSKTKKDPKASQEEKPAGEPNETDAKAPAEKPERIDPKKYFK